MGSWNSVKDVARCAVNSLNIIKRQSQQIKELQAENSALLAKLTEKNKIITSVQTALDNNGEIISEHCAYWRKDGLGNIIEGPFCTSCFITESALRPIVQAQKPKNYAGNDWEWVECSHCRAPFRQKQVGQYLKSHIK
jgi:hypothetical protein